MGSLFGPAGAMFGGKAGDLLASITGFGDYQVESNSLMTGGLSPPQIVNSVNNGGIIVRHREYIGDLLTPTPISLGPPIVPNVYSVQTYSVQPGVSGTFPWLSQIATAFEEYEFRGLIFEFKSLSSDAVLSSAASSALGFVAMATQYNAANPAFSDKKSLENYEFSNSNKPSCSFIHPIECKRKYNVDTHLYTRNGSVPVGQDIKTYDLGTLNVAIGGIQGPAGAVIGELWCTYEIELFHPKYTINAGALGDHISVASFTNANPLGPAADTQLGVGSNLGLIKTTNSLTFPSYVTDGEYSVGLYWLGSASVAVTYPTATYFNCQQVRDWTRNTNLQFQSPGPGVTSISMAFVTHVTITGPNASITYSGGNYPTGTQVLDIWVSDVNTITS